MEEQKNMANAYKQKLNNDEKFDEITKKEDELKNLKQEFQEIEKEYQYLLKSNRRMDGFHNNLLDDEINYYTTELKNIKGDITLKNKEHIKYNENIKETRKEINSLEKIYDLIQKNIEFKKEINKNHIFFNEEITNEIVETEKENLTNQVESAANVYKKLLKEKDNLESKETKEIKEDNNHNNNINVDKKENEEIKYALYEDKMHEELINNLPLSFLKLTKNNFKWIRPDEYITNEMLDKEIKILYPKKKYIQMREDIKLSYETEKLNKIKTAEKENEIKIESEEIEDQKDENKVEINEIHEEESKKEEIKIEENIVEENQEIKIEENVLEQKVEEQAQDQTIGEKNQDEIKDELNEGEVHIVEEKVDENNNTE